MVKFRPHILKVTVPGGDSVYDQNTGNYETPPPTEIEASCRISPNGSGRKVANQDGNLVEYSYLVHASNTLAKIPFGSAIEVYEGTELKAKGNVIGFWSNSMNTRIWL